MGPVTRQELQSMLDASRNRLLEKIVTKSDLSQLQDLTKTVLQFFQQNQQMMKQLEYQLLQVTRRDTLLEARLATVEHDLKELKAEVLRMLDLEPMIMRAYGAGQQKQTAVYATGTT